jgi:hypothetical protein
VVLPSPTAGLPKNAHEVVFALQTSLLTNSIASLAAQPERCKPSRNNRW